jgi:hypothetical protein
VGLTLMQRSGAGHVTFLLWQWRCNAPDHREPFTSGSLV